MVNVIVSGITITSFKRLPILFSIQQKIKNKMSPIVAYDFEDNLKLGEFATTAEAAKSLNIEDCCDISRALLWWHKGKSKKVYSKDGKCSYAFAMGNDKPKDDFMPFKSAIHNPQSA